MSTIDAITSLMDAIEEGFEGREHTVGVFLDLGTSFLEGRSLPRKQLSSHFNSASF
ncbi:hypothetical protein J6590_045620, partial [Homalodisca vitripennis]